MTILIEVRDSGAVCIDLNWLTFLFSVLYARWCSPQPPKWLDLTVSANNMFNLMDAFPTYAWTVCNFPAGQMYGQSGNEAPSTPYAPPRAPTTGMIPIDCRCSPPFFHGP
jgi:hypothetical protein